MNGQITAGIDTAPVLYHDGCALCLDIAATLAGSIPGLRIVDLGLCPDAARDATDRGVRALPSLVIGGKVMPVAPHSGVVDAGAQG